MIWRQHEDTKALIDQGLLEIKQIGARNVAVLGSGRAVSASFCCRRGAVSAKEETPPEAIAFVVGAQHYNEKVRVISDRNIHRSIPVRVGRAMADESRRM